jgi:hypothetical protein
MDFDNFIIGKKKTDRRGEERGELAKKSNSCLPIIYRGVKKAAAASQT